MKESNFHSINEEMEGRPTGGTVPQIAIPTTFFMLVALDAKSSRMVR